MNEPSSPTQPERRPRRTIAIAVVGLLALIGGCASWRIPRYVNDKVARARTCLSDAKLSYRHLTLTPGPLSLRVTGMTQSDDQAKIEKALQACSGLGTVKFGEESSDTAPAAQRFAWETAGGDEAGSASKITVSGSVRSEDERSRVLASASAAAGDATVEDKLDVADVASNAPTLDRLLKFLPQLHELIDPAMVTVTGTDVKIEGGIDPANTPALSDLAADMAAAGISPTIELQTGTAPTAVSSEAAVEVTFRGDSAAITGTVPSEADVASIRSTVGQSFDTWDTTGLKVGSSDTGSDSVVGLAAALPDIMAGLSEGRATLSGENVTVEGVPGTDALNALTAAAAALKRHKMTATIETADPELNTLIAGAETETGTPASSATVPTTAPPTTAPAATTPPTTAPAATTATTTTAPLSSANKAISDQLSALVASSPIPFQTGSATLGAGATTILDQIATLLKAATGVKVRIEGHTDSQGDAAANQLLSESRANAVFEALAARGVSRSTMTAAGLGDTRPIADNATAEGRAQNRRVVFVLSQA